MTPIRSWVQKSRIEHETEVELTGLMDLVKDFIAVISVNPIEDLVLVSFKSLRLGTFTTHGLRQSTKGEQ